MQVRITGPEPRFIDYVRKCWVENLPFYFHHTAYDLVFFEIKRNDDDTVKRIDFEIMERK